MSDCSTSAFKAKEPHAQMTKSKRQLRAEAVERLRKLNCMDVDCYQLLEATVDDAGEKVGYRVEIRKLIDLLTDNEIPKGDALDELRFYAEENRYDYDPLTDTFKVDERLSELCENVSEMVERDYVHREAYDDLRDEFVWTNAFLHRMGKKCGTKDVPSLVAYVDKLEARVEELEAIDRRIAETDSRWEAAIRDLERMKAERDELQRQLDTMRDVTREFRDERDEWKAKAEGYAEALEKLDCSVLANGTVFAPHNLDAQSRAEIENVERSRAVSGDSGQDVDVDSTEDAKTAQDTREKLEADVKEICWGKNDNRYLTQKRYLSSAGIEVDEGNVMANHEGHVLMTVIMHLLDRQASITERHWMEICGAKIVEAVKR